MAAAVNQIRADQDRKIPPARHPLAVAGLVVSGHKATSPRFIEQSACAALTMFASVRENGGFRGDLILMAGPLGAQSPHDPKSWAATGPSRWRAEHVRATRQLAKIVAKDDVEMWDLVPVLLSNKYPAMKRNLNYMKLAVYLLPHDKAMFVDLDVVVVGELSSFFQAPGALVGYRTCTSPVNSGFFVVKPSQRSHLAALDELVSRNRCPCRHDRQPFAESGYDAYGPIKKDLAELWTRSTKSDPQLCTAVVQREHNTWNFAGAGTGQGLMFYYFALLLKSYTSYTYSQLPIVHYNSPRPKPWSSHYEAGSSRPEIRQHCDFVWWRAFQTWRHRHGNSTFCDSLFLPNLEKKRTFSHFSIPSCCRTCPGGGHFASAARCNATAFLDNYARALCRPVAQLLDLS